MQPLETIAPTKEWTGGRGGKGREADPYHVGLWDAAMQNVGQICIFDVPDHDKINNAEWIKRPRSFFDQRARSSGYSAMVRLHPNDSAKFGVRLSPKEVPNDQAHL